ncbi:amidophosphoribosyltransferase [Clostridium sp. D2Q-11]|uniref:Amidophosphoribosyltransferase n=1 Tax=Anaeromonas frigoriresistens TaxID=2683708 RepID=A0A942Z6E9_9FIRM|nr:amidophosphoribosyltransferase [Anaeromonas frigoriresistens]MBS4538401.1 amidophosphoribosyltransferase [Anaeromonas frigoriresistens]
MERNYTVDKMQEECGVFGLFNNKDVDISNISYIALSALQHRGQESCGIAIYEDSKLKCYKEMGLVSNFFIKEEVRKIKGKSFIGHVRYSTSGESNLINAQPILSNKMALAHNGNIVNGMELKEELMNKGVGFETSVDSEVILKLIQKLDKDPIEQAISKSIEKINGGYSVLILTEEKLIGFRDPQGIRPLCIGKLKDSYILCSESCAIDALGGELIREVNPGEIVTIDFNGVSSSYIEGKNNSAICAFEYIYFARPNSIIDNLSVYKSRINMGKKLWEEAPISADIVIGVPESGNLAAIGFSNASGVPYDIGFVKNDYIGRTFIEPESKKREKNLDIKLRVIKDSIKGKRVVVVDDSIVRGTTSKKIVSLLRDAGAKEIHFRSASPVIKYPCFYGIDTADCSNLLGSYMKVEEIRKAINADSLKYISIEGLKDAIGQKCTCLKCFTQ